MESIFGAEFGNLSEFLETSEVKDRERFKSKLGDLIQKSVSPEVKKLRILKRDADTKFVQTARIMFEVPEKSGEVAFLSNLRNGKGSDNSAIAVLLLACLTKEMSSKTNRFFDTVGADASKTLEDSTDGTIEPLYDLKSILTGQVLDELQTDPSAPVLTSPEETGAYHFTDTTVETLGRLEEKEKLDKFIEAGTGFFWMQIAGVGGQGKSRLAYDLVKKCQRSNPKWTANFLVGENVHAFASEQRARKWQPKQSTLIVIDYVVGQEHDVGTIIRALAQRGDFKVAVRLLLVERQRWDRGALKYSATGISNSEGSPKLEIGSGNSEWFLKLFEGKPDFERKLRNVRFNDGVMELNKLEKPELLDIVDQVVKSEALKFDGSQISFSDDEIYAHLQHIDKEGRPLYAYFLAKSLVAGKFQKGWSREDLLKDVLTRDRNRRWRRDFKGEPPALDDDSPAMRLAVVATITGGVDAQQVNDYYGDVTTVSKSCRHQALVLTDSPIRGGIEGIGKIVGPLRPDILGEWMALTCFGEGLMPKTEIFSVCWRLNPKGTAAFVLRATQDFPSLAEDLGLFEIDPEIPNATEEFAAVSADIFGELFDEVRTDYPDQILNGICYASDIGIPSGAMALGYCLSTGTGFKQDEEAAFLLFEKAAKLGNMHAKTCLGYCYENGIGTEPSPDKAYQLHKEAAATGNVQAKVNLGHCYKDGVGIELDPNQAFSLFEEAAEAGSSSGKSSLGMCYQYGVGTDPDPDQAFKLYRIAADAGHIPAKFNLGLCFDLGVGTVPDAKQAFRLYEEAAAAGNVSAKVNLGVCYELGFGIGRDQDHAFHLYKEAAGKGDILAKSNLGVCYEKGIGTEPNQDLAFRLYKEAADRGNIRAISNLGLCFEFGIGTDPCPDQAFVLFQEAAAGGNTEAKVNLGVRYEQGIGTDPDPQMAFRLYQEAAGAGNAIATINLAACYQLGVGTDPDPEKAFALYQVAADLGNATANTNLANCYQIGIGTDPDPKTAFRLFQEAAKAGDAAARQILLSFPDLKTPKFKKFKDVWSKAQTADWPLPPLIPGRWSIIGKSNSIAEVTALKRFSHLGLGNGTQLLSLRRLNLGFYLGWNLIEALLMHSGSIQSVCLLYNGDKAFLLNGMSNILHYANVLGQIELSDPQVAIEYLSFFCMATGDSEGTFRVVEELEQRQFAKPLQANEFAKLKKLIEPASTISETATAWKISATVQHGSELGRAEFLLPRTDNVGSVQMLSDKSISSDLPFWRYGFDGVYRTRWETESQDDQ